jgi:hypothetical protein
MLMVLGKTVRLEVGGGADASGRNAASSYVHRKGELSGIIKLVLLWHAIGHKVSQYISCIPLQLMFSQKDDPVISKDFIKSASQFSKTTKTIAGLEILSHGVNATLEAIDNVQYKALVELRQKAEVQNPFVKAFGCFDSLAMEGRAIMYNRQTPVHPDRQDPFTSWATMITLGTFCEGGDLYIPRLKLQICYLPGDMVVLRGRILPHEVMAWGVGQRISIAHFTHQSLWDSFEMSCP